MVSSVSRTLFQFMEVSRYPFTQTASISVPINIRQWNCILIRCKVPSEAELLIRWEVFHPKRPSILVSNSNFLICVNTKAFD